jgi:CRISPR-associated protein Cas1
MSYRHIFLSEKTHLSIENGQLIIKKQDTKVLVPPEDISAILVESREVTMTSGVLSTFAEHGVALFSCDETHLPNGCFLSYNAHSRQLKMMTQQLELPKPFVKQVWQSLIKQKIINQADCLERFQRNSVEKLRALANKVESGDKTYKESEAARVYFQALFGPGFARRKDDIQNSALNYAYAIVRGLIARSIVAHGFYPAFGLFHKSELNNFNLVDDFIEPFRPIIDSFVIQIEELLANGDLVPALKKKLFSVVAMDVRLNQEIITLNLAVANMMKSFVTCVNKSDSSHLQLPSMKK